MYVFYLNILWMLFTLGGLVVFGWMPATIATYATWRKLLRDKEKTIPIFKTFFSEYKRAFVKKNIIGLIMLAGGFLVGFYLSFYQYTEGVVNVIYLGFLFIIIVIFLNLIVYFPPVMVHFQLNFAQYFKHALFIGFLSRRIIFFFTMGISFCLFSFF